MTFVAFFLALMLMSGIYGQDIQQTNPTPLVKSPNGEMQDSFRNRLAIPSKMYILQGIENNCFFKPIVMRWRPNNDYVRFGFKDKTKLEKHLSTVATIKDSNDGSILNVNLINSDWFETIDHKEVQICSSKPFEGDQEAIVSIIGDSYTKGMFYNDALIEKNMYQK